MRGVIRRGARDSKTNQDRRDASFERIVRRACDHKFVDSNVCLKCGWTPTPVTTAAPKGGQ